MQKREEIHPISRFSQILVANNRPCLSSRSEATIAGLLSQQTDDARAVHVKNKHRHGEAEVLEVLTDAEEVGTMSTSSLNTEAELTMNAARASKPRCVSTELKLMGGSPSSWRLRSEKEKSITCWLFFAEAKRQGDDSEVMDYMRCAKRRDELTYSGFDFGCFTSRTTITIPIATRSKMPKDFIM